MGILIIQSSVKPINGTLTFLKIELSWELLETKPGKRKWGLSPILNIY